MTREILGKRSTTLKLLVPAALYTFQVQCDHIRRVFTLFPRFPSYLVGLLDAHTTEYLDGAGCHAAGVSARDAA